MTEKQIQNKVQEYILLGEAEGTVYVWAGPNAGEVTMKEETLAFFLSKCITFDFAIEEIKLHPWPTLKQVFSRDLSTFVSGYILGAGSVLGLEAAAGF